jgi:molybdate transport system substrate-binding protein
MGENIAQTLQFVDSTSANAGFVAKSMLLADNKFKPACEWEIPNDLYDPINQKMVVLKHGKGKPVVIAFWKFMQSPEAAVIIRDNGYDVP